MTTRIIGNFRYTWGVAVNMITLKVEEKLTGDRWDTLMQQSWTYREGQEQFDALGECLDAIVDLGEDIPAVADASGGAS